MRDLTDSPVRLAAGLAAALGALLLVTVTTAQSQAAYSHASTDDTAQLAAAATAAARTTHTSGRAATSTYDPASPDQVRLTQANMHAGDTVKRFQADVATILAGQPDFITYNEVPERQDVVLAPPPGYAIWRTPGTYTGETPVAWRTDRWSLVSEGTTMLSNQTGRLPGQKLDWGIRYANWVTLRNAYGRVVSVVSAHLTPVTKITTVQLQAQEIDNLGTLVDTLGASGPVLVGGDMNMNYQTPEYLGALYAQYGMVPSYDALGAKLPTGDYHGATIDYVFLHQDVTAPAMGFLDQFTTELNSDHKAVTADLAFTQPTGPPPYSLVTGTTTTDPSGTPAERRAALRTMAQAIDHTPAGAAVHLTTKKLSSPYLRKALNRAIDRGVHVQLIFRNADRTGAERHFVKRLGQHKWKKHFARGCDTSCRKVAAKHGVPATELLISNVAGTTAVKMLSDRSLTTGSTSQATTLKVVANKSWYDVAFRRFFRMAGHPL